MRLLTQFSRLFLIVFALVLMRSPGQAQDVETVYPKTLFCPNDTFRLKFSHIPTTETMTVSGSNIEEAGKNDYGTDALPNLVATLYYGMDSVKFRYHCLLPYSHIYFIPLESPKGKTTLKLHFNRAVCYFSTAHLNKIRGQVRYEVPEVYELANVLWVLSAAGQRANIRFAGSLPTESAYYRRVEEYFRPYRSHAVFKALDVPDSSYFQQYFDFRENSFAFRFAHAFENGAKRTNTLLYGGSHYYVTGSSYADGSLFGRLKPLVEDFARVSHFRRFYAANKRYYERERKRLSQLLSVRDMWRYLEKEFPGERYNAYTIVFSPLIGSSHSTQQYWHLQNYPAYFRECVMFICGADRYDHDSTLTESQKKGLMSGIVFTEIDHNYVNPTSNKYAAQIDSLFAKRGKWVRENAGNTGYGSPISVFNEYMTHALHCLYVQERFDAATAAFVIQNRIELNAEKRGFVRFREFTNALFDVRKHYPTRTMKELYPLVLDWCGN